MPGDNVDLYLYRVYKDIFPHIDQFGSLEQWKINNSFVLRQKWLICSLRVHDNGLIA